MIFENALVFFYTKSNRNSEKVADFACGDSRACGQEFVSNGNGGQSTYTFAAHARLVGSESLTIGNEDSVGTPELAPAASGVPPALRGPPALFLMLRRVWKWSDFALDFRDFQNSVFH